jgi:hypothetical protein
MSKTSKPITIFESSKFILPKLPKLKNAKGLNNFIINSFNANFNFRFRNEPFMTKSFRDGRKESIAGHMWGTALLWLTLKNHCSNFSKLVNSEKILEILLHHDLGEIIRGDKAIYDQLYSDNEDKIRTERQDFQRIIKDLPIASQGKLLYFF